MLFKLRQCIQRLCKFILPAYTKSWLDRTNKKSFNVMGFSPSAYWLAYSLHPRTLTPIWNWMQGCTKPMLNHAHPWTIISHPCPLMNNNIAPMPTQNPWAWVGMGMSMGMGTQCRALLHTTLESPWSHLEANGDGLWTLSFGLSQCHGHGSWLVCEVALSIKTLTMYWHFGYFKIFTRHI
jgi:hypothetical protein